MSLSRKNGEAYGTLLGNPRLNATGTLGLRLIVLNGGATALMLDEVRSDGLNPRPGRMPEGGFLL